MGNRSVNDSERTILRSQPRRVIVVAYVASIVRIRTVSSSQECVRYWSGTRSYQWMLLKKFLKYPSSVTAWVFRCDCQLLANLSVQ